jgi:flagellar biosynthetic protein FliR
MMAIADLAGIGQAAIWAFAAIFLRVGALVTLLPGFGERTVPARLRLAIAIAFAAIVAPVIGPVARPGDLPGLARFAGAEVVVGLALGMGLRLFVLALQTAGTIAAQSTSLAQILGGAAIEPIPAMGYLLVLGGITLAVILGLHVRAAELLILSYALFPPGGWPDPAALATWGIGRTAHAFGLAFSLAAPFVIASLLYNLALGAINRAMPQLMVAFVGAPAITLGGLVLLALVTPALLTLWAEGLAQFAANPLAPPP